MEAELDISEYEMLLDAKIDPLIKTIEKLETSQGKMVEVMMTQSRMNEALSHLQKSLDDHLRESNTLHNELFNRLRELDKNSECKVVQKELSVVQKDLSEEIEGVKDKHQDKWWAFIEKILIAMGGGMLVWWFKK